MDSGRALGAPRNDGRVASSAMPSPSSTVRAGSR